MSYEADKRYNGTVAGWDFWESSDGRLALTLDIQAHGESDTLRHFLWLNDDGKERTAKVLDEFGIKASDATFWEEMEADEPTCRLVGMPCDFTTKLGKNGKVQTQYLNGPQRAKRDQGGGDRRKGAAKARGIFSVGNVSDDAVPF